MNSVRTLLSTVFFLNLLGGLALPLHAFDDLLISEFMAQNDNTLADEDGDFPDWIEIYNAYPSPVGASGRERRRRPVAANTALPMAGAIVMIGVSPAPLLGKSLRSSKTTSMNGASLKRGTR